MVSKLASHASFLRKLLHGVLHQNESVHHEEKGLRYRKECIPHTKHKDNLCGQRKSCREGKVFYVAHLGVSLTQSGSVNSAH